MLSTKEKAFFASIAHGAAGLSDCDEGRGATLIKGRRLLSYGCNRKVVQKGEWEVSAISDAMFGSHELDLSGTTLFSTYFPLKEDVKLIAAASVSELYFFGKIVEPEAVDILNRLHKEGIDMKVTKLE